MGNRPDSAIHRQHMLFGGNFWPRHRRAFVFERRKSPDRAKLGAKRLPPVCARRGQQRQRGLRPRGGALPFFLKRAPCRRARGQKLFGNRRAKHPDGKTEPKTRDEILHIPGLTLDAYIGITPLTYAALTVDIGLSQDKFERNFYHNRASTSGIFQYPNELGEEAFQRLKKDIKKNYTGLSNAGIPMILEGGGQFKEITMKLTDAQFLESKRFRIEDVCRIFRVPLHLVQDLTRSTNNNIEHQSLEFIVYTMLPWFKRWEENLNLQLLSNDSKRRNRYFEFNISGLLRGDIKSRYEAYAQGRQWGWLSVNDIRRLENMNPVEGGDIYMQPLNCIDATMANEYFKKQDESKNKIIREEIFNLINEGK